jgi:Glycosyltransferase family 87
MYLLGMSPIRGHNLLFDFRGGLYDAGHQILHGQNPYRPVFLEVQAAVVRAGGIALGETSQHAFSIPVYPAPINLAVVPFSLLPFWLAGVLFTLISIGAMVLGLRLLGVRDWRCFAVALTSLPFVFALDLGALGPLLVLGAGVAWRWRDRLWPPAIAIASIVVAKVFPWPLGIWLLVTRRFRTLALAIVIGAVACFAAWAVIGFDGLAQYPRMLSDLSQIEQGRALSLVAVLLAVGVPATLAKAAALAATAGLLGLAWRFARRPGGDAQAFGLAVLAALTSSPIVWEHYMVLLFVPIALVSPRFSKLWLVPVCTPLLVAISAAVVPLGSTRAVDTHSLREAALWLVLEAIVGYRVCRGDRAGATLGVARWVRSARAGRRSSVRDRALPARITAAGAEVAGSR